MRPSRLVWHQRPVYLHIYSALCVFVGATVCQWLNKVLLPNFGVLPTQTLQILERSASSGFPASVSVEDTGLLRIRWMCRWERNVSSNQPRWSCWLSCPGRQRKATVRVGLASERERTLCRPVLNVRPATPERWLFSQQLHLTRRETANEPRPRENTVFQCSSCDLICRGDVFVLRESAQNGW